jgi:hypothetical protein
MKNGPGQMRTAPHFIRPIQNNVDDLRKRVKKLRCPDYWAIRHDLW